MKVVASSSTSEMPVAAWAVYTQCAYSVQRIRSVHAVYTQCCTYMQRMCSACAAAWPAGPHLDLCEGLLVRLHLLHRRVRTLLGSAPAALEDLTRLKARGEGHSARGWGSG